MKFRCIYCTHAFEAEALPPACPSCAATFSQVVTPDTPLRRVIRALRKNGRTLAFDLRARLPQDHPEHMDVALACAPDDREPRPAGCASHLKAGNSPCPVHGDDDR